jgi:hypothetical protein
MSSIALKAFLCYELPVATPPDWIEFGPTTSRSINELMVRKHRFAARHIDFIAHPLMGNF